MSLLTDPLFTTQQGIRQIPNQLRIQLVNNLQKNLFTLLEKGIKSVLLGADEALFKCAEEARNNNTQRLFFDGIQALRPQRKKIAEVFLKNHLDEFKAYFTGQAKSNDFFANDSENDKDDLKLSLLNKEEYEESLLVKTMAGKVQKKHALELIVLRRRLEVLANTKYSKRTLTPLCPESIANSFYRALTNTALPLTIKTTLYMLFDQHIMTLLERFYAAVNQLLIQHQVLPQLTTEKVLAEQTAKSRAEREAKNKQKAATQLNTANANPAIPTNFGQPTSAGYTAYAHQSTHTSSGIGGTAQTGGFDGSQAQGFNHSQASINQINQQQQIASQIAEISQLLQSCRQTLGDVFPSGSKSLNAFAPTTASETYTQDSVLTALQSLQQQQAQSPNQVVAANSDDFKQAIYKTLAKNHKNAKNFKVGAQQANSIDLVGLLFDFINEDHTLAKNSKKELAALQTLYVQIALNDPLFFQNLNHPARLLLNSMAQASSLFQDAAEESTLQTAIKETVREALLRYQGDSSVISKLLEKFNALIETLKQRATRREQRAIEAAKGRDKLLAARKQARGLINACLRRYNPPSIIQQFLIHSWSDVLVFVFLRSGPSSAQWQNYAKVAEQLAWSGTPLSTDEQATLVEIRRTLLDSIRQGLELLGCHPAAEIKHLLQDLVICQQAVQARQSHIANRLKTSLTSSQQTLEEEQESVNELKETDLDDSALSLAYKLKQVEFGTWFEFKNPACRLKLAWFSPTTHNYMFVDGSGQRSQIKSLAQLAVELESGEAKIITEEQQIPFFDRALSAIQRTLQRFAGTYKATQTKSPKNTASP